MTKQSTVYMVTRNDAAGRCYSRELPDISEMAGEEVGVAITITVVEMPQDDYDRLPEFRGW